MNNKINGLVTMALLLAYSTKALVSGVHFEDTIVIGILATLYAFVYLKDTVKYQKVTDNKLSELESEIEKLKKTQEDFTGYISAAKLTSSYRIK